MFEGGSATSRRLPFHFQAHGGVGRLVLSELNVGLITVDKLELEVSDLGTDPGHAVAERFQRRRTRLRGLAVRIAQHALDERVAQLRKPLAGLGITQLSARLNDGFVSMRARAADGLATADLSFHVELVGSGAQLRALASAVRVHGHLPTPGAVIADRLLVTLLGAGEAAGVAERPHARGLCDVEIDLVGAVLWHVLPPSGWRLPAVTELELTHIRIARTAVEIAYGPSGTRSGELGVSQNTQRLAAAHDLMHSVDHQLRGGHLEDAMRGYRGLLASSGPDQPLVLDRILALAAARPAWFFDGLELARQALVRWPSFAPAHAALASITLAQGDAREAAKHLEAVARLASADGDDDQASLAALAAARLLRVLDPRVATQLYQLALEHDPSSADAADSLADRLADEQRWPDLVRLVRTRAAAATEPVRAVQLHLRLADVFAHQLGDRGSAEHELTVARQLAPEDPAVHEMAAMILGASDPAAAIAAWREVARLAELRGDHRTCARAWARLGDLLAASAAGDSDEPAEPTSSAAEDAWRRSLELDPLQADALVGLANAAAARNDHAIAADLYERLRGLGLVQAISARHELALARSLVPLGRTEDARTSLRRATLAGGETAAEAHAMFAEIADAALDREHAAAELDTAIAGLAELAAGDHPDSDRLYTRAAELAVARAMLFDKTRQSSAAEADWQRAHALARQVAPEIARDAARTLLARSGHDAGLERRWIDAVLATRPPQAERAALLVRRADVRRRERSPDLGAALADLHEAVELIEDAPEIPAGGHAIVHTDTRRRAYQLEAQLFAQSGDQRSRAQALAALAKLAERAADRVASETAAAAAWLAADEPAAALPHGARAHASLSLAEVPAALRREVLVTLGEAAWRQRAWPDVVRAYRGLLEDPGAETPRQATFRYRLAVAADRAGDPSIALAALRPLIDDPAVTRDASPELRGQALRLFADLAERAGDLIAAATALEGFAAIGEGEVRTAARGYGAAAGSDGAATARADAVHRAGELFRRADRGDDAIRCLETALRISDAHMPALDALEAAWRERRDLERVAVILGRKVAATARHPGRQKPLLSRLGDLQDQLGRPEVARETHQRALEIDPMWRPSLRYVTLGLRDAGQVVAAAGGLAQLAGELHGDTGVDLAIVTRERQIAAEALAELVARLDDAQVEAVRAVARPALERAALDNADVAGGLARLRGEVAPAVPVTDESEENTPSGRVAAPTGAALSLRDAAARARAAGKLDDAFATLETANHVNPGDVAVLRDLVELATELSDHTASARHLTALALRLTGARRGDALLELADVYYDKLDDAVRGRETMRKAADAFGSGTRRDATLRMLATEAGTHLAWDVVVEALLSIPLDKRTQADFTSLATALMRAGRDVDALASIEAATAAGRFDDGGELVRHLQHEIQRKIHLVRSLEDRADSASGDEAAALLEEAQQLRVAIGQPGNQPLRDTAAPAGETPKGDTAPWPLRTKTKPGVPIRHVAPAPVGARPPATRPPPPGRPPAPAGVIRSNPAIAFRGAVPATPRTDAATEAGSQDVPVHETDEPSSGVPRAVEEPSISEAAEEIVATALDATDTPRRTTRTYGHAGPDAGSSADRAEPRAEPRSMTDANTPAATDAASSSDGAWPPATVEATPGTEAGQTSASVQAEPRSIADVDATDMDEVSSSVRAEPGSMAEAGAATDAALVSEPGSMAGVEAVSHASAVSSNVRAEPGSMAEAGAATDAAPVSEPGSMAGVEAATHASSNVRAEPGSMPDVDATTDAAPVSEPGSMAGVEAVSHASAVSSNIRAEPGSMTDVDATFDANAVNSRGSEPGSIVAGGAAAGVGGPEAGDGPDAPAALDVPDHTEAGDAAAAPAGSEAGDAAAAAARGELDDVAAAAAGGELGDASQGSDEPSAAEARDHRAVPIAVAHSTSIQMSAVDDPVESPDPAHATPQPTLGRIKLVPRMAARPGAEAAQPQPVESFAEDDTEGWQSVSDPKLKSGPARARTVSGIRTPAAAASETAAGSPSASEVAAEASVAEPPRAPDSAADAGAAAPRPRAVSEVDLPPVPSVTITGTPDETALALLLAAASADRDRLFAARQAEPNDPAVLLALLAHLGDREPGLRRELLDETVRTSHGRAKAIALHELAVQARENRDPARATALWSSAYEADPSFPPVWMPLADALAASDDISTARELYDAVAHSVDYDPARRAFAADRAEALGRDDSIVSGEIQLRGATDLEEARLLAESEDWPGAIDAAERAAAARPNDTSILEVLEKIYFASGNVTAASEAIGRQLMLVEEPGARAALWRRRAKMYRETPGRDAEAYRCLKEAQACAPADPEIAYQLRKSAMVRGEWPLAVSLLYREIAAAATPRDRGALHLELALMFDEKLDDAAQAQTNHEQALAFDPTIPAVKLPLARRYEAIGRSSDAARLYEEAAATARAAERAGLLEAAARCRATAAEATEPDLAAQLDRAEAAGDLDAALELAQQLWRADPGHPAAFRTLANVHRASGDLAALTELTGVRARRAETPDERATAWVEVARLAEDIGALDRAARSYDLALIEDPGHVSALDARGALAFRLGDFATADLIYRDLGTGESVLGDDELALRRSIVAEQLGRDSEALLLAQTAASLAPGRRDVMMRVQELATRIGELQVALAAARHVLELVPLDDDEAQLATQFAVVELLREDGQLDEAVAQLERILRDHPVNAAAIEALAQVHAARGDWASATRYLYQLVPLAPSPVHRAERLYQLGEAVLLHVRDVDRADDVFLRASDLDPGHVPTLRRLLDVYWRADDPGGIVEVATELADKGALISGPTSDAALARALVAAALVGDTQLAQRLQSALGDDAPREVAASLAELAGRNGRLQLATASTAIAELARRGLIDLAKLRAAAAGTAAANAL